MVNGKRSMYDIIGGVQSELFVQFTNYVSRAQKGDPMQVFDLL